MLKLRVARITCLRNCMDIRDNSDDAHPVLLSDVPGLVLLDSGLRWWHHQGRRVPWFGKETGAQEPMAYRLARQGELNAAFEASANLFRIGGNSVEQVARFRGLNCEDQRCQ